MGSLAPGQRWSASRKRDVVLRLLRGESLEALSREVGVEIYRSSTTHSTGRICTERYMSALLHESSRARTMPTDRILTCRFDMTRVGRARSSD